MKYGLNILKKIFIVLTLYFFIDSFIQNYGSFEVIKNQIDYSLLVGSFIIYISFVFGLGLLRSSMLPINISIKDISYIQFTSRLGRYMPGKVGTILSKIYFLNKYHNIPSHKGFVFSLNETIMTALSAGLLGSYFLVGYLKDVIINDYMLFLILIFFLILITIFLSPHLFYRILNYFLTLLKKENFLPSDYLTRKQLLWLLLKYILLSIINGVGLYIFILSLGVNGGISLWGTISLWNFAGIVGLLALFAPGGIGVREGILFLAFSNTLGNEVATIIAVTSRLWSLVADGCIFLLLTFLKPTNKKEKKKESFAKLIS